MSKLQILFITGGSPWPPNIGVNQRTNLLLRALKNCGSVDTVINSRYTKFSSTDWAYLREEYQVVAHIVTSDAGQKWPWRILEPFSPTWACRLAKHIGGVRIDYQPDPAASNWLARRLENCCYDIIVGRYLRPTATSAALRYKPVVLDLDDFDTEVVRTRLRSASISRLKKYSAKRELKQLESVVACLLDRCDHIWVTSAADQALLGSRPSSVLPNIPFIQEKTGCSKPCAPQLDCNIVLMVGSLLHTVNVRGIDRFIKCAWPIIRKAQPNAEFHIVGCGMTSEQRNRWKSIDGVRPIGFVEKLGDAYGQCAFAIVPLFEGGGTKIKVAESLIYGRTCVVTTHSQRGYENVLYHLDSLWIANSDAELAEGCIRLLRDPAQRIRMAERGRQIVRKHYTFDRFQKLVEQAVEKVTSAGKGVCKHITC